MKPLRNRFQEIRARLGMPWEVLERDYLLSWVLAGIGRMESLRETLVFKGGTALKKCYYGTYRFSEDLDFSALGGVPTGKAMEEAIIEACSISAELVNEYAPIEIVGERYTEKEPHPGRQEAFKIRARFPWHRKPQTGVMVEITMDEQILKPIDRRSVIHQYGEPFDLLMPVYSREEIVAEKLRAILQHTAKLQERGWSRSRARDYYDLWRIFASFRESMDLSDFPGFLRAKCALRKVTFRDSDDFFQDIMVDYVRKTWRQWLEPLVPDLPSCDTVIRDLRPQIAALLK